MRRIFNDEAPTASGRGQVPGPMQGCAPGGPAGGDDFDQVAWFGQLTQARATVVLSTSKPHTNCAVYLNTENQAGLNSATLNIYAVVRGTRVLVATFTLAASGASPQGPYTAVSQTAESYDVELVPSAPCLTTFYVTAIGYGYESATALPEPFGAPGTVLTISPTGGLEWAAAAGGGITQLTQDGTAGPGSGSQALTVVQAQNGADTFHTDGTIFGYLNSGTAGVGWRLGRDPSSTSNVALFVNGNLSPGGDAFANAIFNTSSTVLNAPGFGSELDLAVLATPYVELRTTELAIPDQGTMVAVSFFESIATAAYGAIRRVIGIFNATTDETPSQAVAGAAVLYSQTNTNGEPQGLVTLGAKGALTSMAPNGIGTQTGQAMVESRERSVGQTILGTTNTFVSTMKIPNGSFLAKIRLLGRVTTAGGSAGAIGDAEIIASALGGKCIAGAVTTGILTPDPSTLYTDGASFGGTTFTIGTAANAITLTIDVTSAAGGAGMTANWQVDWDVWVD
jgi:hypothetical protein